MAIKKETLEQNVPQGFSVRDPQTRDKVAAAIGPGYGKQW